MTIRTSGKALTAIHQFLPTFADRDAIGSHVLEVQRLIRSLGLASEIYSEDIHPEMRSKAHRFEALAAATGGSTAGLLYHASTGCRNFDSLLAWGGPFFVDYHNITDPAFFERWSPGASDNMRLARRQLAQLASRCDVAIAHSSFSPPRLTYLRSCPSRRISHAVSTIAPDFSTFWPFTSTLPASTKACARWREGTKPRSSSNLSNLVLSLDFFTIRIARLPAASHLSVCKLYK